MFVPCKNLDLRANYRFVEPHKGDRRCRSRRLDRGIVVEVYLLVSQPHRAGASDDLLDHPIHACARITPILTQCSTSRLATH